MLLQWRSQGTLWLAFVSFVFLGVFTCLARSTCTIAKIPTRLPITLEKFSLSFPPCKWSNENTKMSGGMQPGKTHLNQLCCSSYPKMHLCYRPIGTQLGSTVQKRWKISQGLSGETYSIWIHLGGLKYFHEVPVFHLISFLSSFCISASLSRMTSDLYYFPEDRNVFQSILTISCSIQALPVLNTVIDTYSRRNLSSTIPLLVLAKYKNHYISNDDCEALQGLKVHTESFSKKIGFMLISC